MSFLQEHQLDIMLFLSGSCGVLAFMTLMPRFMSLLRRVLLASMEFASMLLLLCERVSYLYRGDTSALGGVMVRVGNGMTYFLTLLIPFLVTRFMWDLCRHEGGLTKFPLRLRLCDALFVIGTVLIVLTQFTGLYYTFDAQNRYQRAPLNFISYVFPVLVVILQEWVVLQHRKLLKPSLVIALSISLILPTIASVIQFFLYGVSLISMTTVVVVSVFYVHALCSLGEEVEEAKRHEIAVYREAQQREATLFEETAEALVNAIDAKDKYTRGHSARVAQLSEQIAREAGLSESACDQVYFAALLHDVGKIGVRFDVINKRGRLTDEEYEQIKNHTVVGYQILSSIKESPYLSIGAHYHHERYDGKGYPEGLKGEEIPTIARIIAVADAYDAMTSSRSYRDPLPLSKVREEIVNGMDTQFDSRYASIMLDLMDRDAVAVS